VTSARPYLEYILECLDLIERYAGAGQSEFENDPLVQDGILRRLETLADAASHLPDSLRSAHPEIPWRQVTDFRNVLAHGYREIRLDRVWQVIEHDLPPLRKVFELELSAGDDE
jgi:uncharacterized protein with HEPN domain